MSEGHLPARNIGLDLVRVTEVTALAAGRWIGRGKREEVYRAATVAMAEALNLMAIDGRIVVGEVGRLSGVSPLDTGQSVGAGEGPALDVVVDPIDGTNLLIKGRPGAISLVGVAPRGSMWALAPAIYMEKIVVDRDAAAALVPECMDAPIAWTLALIARVKNKAVRDLVVIILERPRHHDLIEEIRSAGARVTLRTDGDAIGALEVAMPGRGPDLLLGIGGVPEGVIAACAVRAMGGAMLGRLAPQSQVEREAIQAAGLDSRRIITANELVSGNEIYFAATGITESLLLGPVRYHGNIAETDSLLLRTETRTRRLIHAEHLLAEIGV
jgi:fructose-1,6-bisphosphatase II